MDKKINAIKVAMLLHKHKHLHGDLLKELGGSPLPNEKAIMEKYGLLVKQYRKRQWTALTFRWRDIISRQDPIYLDICRVFFSVGDFTNELD